MRFRRKIFGFKHKKSGKSKPFPPSLSVYSEQTTEPGTTSLHLNVIVMPKNLCFQCVSSFRILKNQALNIRLLGTNINLFPKNKLFLLFFCVLSQKPAFYSLFPGVSCCIPLETRVSWRIGMFSYRCF